MNMKKWGSALMLLAMLAAPMLACGFPLPAGTATMAVSKAVCAEGEAAESCRARQDAYQLMNKLQSAAVEDMSMHLYVDDGAEVTEATITGSYDYVLTESSEGLGANVHVRLDEGQMTSADGTEALSGVEFIIVGNKAYTSKDGGSTWVIEDLDAQAMLGVNVLLGLGGPTGTAVDLFSDPAIFSVAPGPATSEAGQTMQVQTLTLDLGKLLGSADALTALMQAGAAAGGAELGLTQEDLGLDPAQVAAMSAMLLPMFTGSSFSTTLYIGADDGYIHRIEDNYVLTMDMTAFDATSKPLKMTYELSGNITRHNEPLLISEPQGAVEGAGLLTEEGGLFGSGGLGSSIFGGQ